MSTGERDQAERQKNGAGKPERCGHLVDAHGQEEGLVRSLAPDALAPELAERRDAPARNLPVWDLLIGQVGLRRGRAGGVV